MAAGLTPKTTSSSSTTTTIPTTSSPSPLSPNLPLLLAPSVSPSSALRHHSFTLPGTPITCPSPVTIRSRMQFLGECELVVLGAILHRSYKIQNCISQDYRVKVSPLAARGIDSRQEPEQLLSKEMNKSKPSSPCFNPVVAN